MERGLPDRGPLLADLPAQKMDEDITVMTIMNVPLKADLGNGKLQFGKVTAKQENNMRFFYLKTATALHTGRPWCTCSSSRLSGGSEDCKQGMTALRCTLLI